jgi:hypothetical protein
MGVLPEGPAEFGARSRVFWNSRTRGEGFFASITSTRVAAIHSTAWGLRGERLPRAESRRRENQSQSHRPARARSWAAWIAHSSAVGSAGWCGVGAHHAPRRRVAS